MYYSNNINLSKVAPEPSNNYHHYNNTPSDNNNTVNANNNNVNANNNNGNANINSIHQSNNNDNNNNDNNMKNDLVLKYGGFDELLQRGRLYSKELKPDINSAFDDCSLGSANQSLRSVGSNRSANQSIKKKD